MYVVIATFLGPPQAELARSLLLAHDIDAELWDDALVGTIWMWSGAVGGVKLAVPEDQAEEARRLLAEDQCEVLAAEVGEEREPQRPATCPACGSTEVVQHDPWTQFGGITMFPGFPLTLLGALLLLDLRAKWKCKSCSHVMR